MDNLVEILTLKKGDNFILPNDSDKEVYIFEKISSKNSLEVIAIKNSGFSTTHFPRYTKVIKL